MVLTLVPRMLPPALSVAMSIYNNETHLALAIESVLDQTFTDFEFLILNDGSTDRSRAIIDDYAKRDRRIRAIHRENKGLIVSLNQLLDEARAPLIARMDGDDICMPQRFEKQMAFLAANPDHGVVGTWTADIDESGTIFLVAGTDHPTSHEEFLNKMTQQSPLCHSSVIMRRDLVRSAGGYHAAFKHCEDYDLWLRLADRTKICSLPERLVHYRHSSGQVSTKYALVQQYGAVVARIACQERRAGRFDPTETLRELPPIEALDDLFGRSGVAAEARAEIVAMLQYSPEAMRGTGFDLMIAHIKAGGTRTGFWRTVVRLALRMGEPRRAAKLATTLLLAKWRAL